MYINPKASTGKNAENALGALQVVNEMRPICREWKRHLKGSLDYLFDLGKQELSK